MTKMILKRGVYKLSLNENKQKYIEVLGKCKNYIDDYDLKNLDVAQMKKEIEDFRVTVPIVGGFSSGKSSMLNKILNEKILAVSIVPETAIPTEVSFNEDENIQAKINGGWKQITREALKANEFNMNNTEIIQAEINNPFLKAIDDVRIVDIPGLDSGIEGHTRAIDNYISKSLAYIVTVDAEQGLKKSVIEFLEELKLYDMPVLIVITKSDKKSEEDISKIFEDVKDKIQNRLQIKTSSIEITSSKQGKLEPVKLFLNQIQQQSEEIFEQKYTKVISGIISTIESYLKTRIENKDFSIEEIEEKEKAIEKQIQEILEKIKNEEERFLEQIKRTIEVIKGKLQMELENSVDSLVHDLLNNRNLNNRISSIVRRVIITGLKEELEPKLQKYFKNIANILDNELNIDDNIELDEIKVKMDKYLEETIKKSIPAIIATIGAILGGPIVAIIGGILTIVVETLFSKKRQEDKRRVAEQKVRNEIIPQVVFEAEKSIDDTILNYTEEIIQQIENSINREKEAKEKSLEDLKVQKQLKLEEQQSVIMQLESELAEVRELYGRI